MRPDTKARYPKDWDRIAYKLKVERNFTCEGCDQQGNQWHNPLTVHHVDYNPANNTRRNLLVLCAKCHLKLQQGTVPRLLQERKGQLRLFNFPGPKESSKEST
jgi:hypothetical protein